MVRHKKEKRPPFGFPKEIVLLETPEGWRHTVLTVEGGMLCGHLDVPIHTSPQEARIAAATMATSLARDFHGTEIEVTWDPPKEPRSWNAHINIAAEGRG